MLPREATTLQTSATPPPRVVRTVMPLVGLVWHPEDEAQDFGFGVLYVYVHPELCWPSVAAQ